MSTDTKLKIEREEIFGPVGALISFKDNEYAVRIANDTTCGLAAGLWTRDISRAHTVARALQAGAVWIDTSLEVDTMTAFGGQAAARVEINNPKIGE